MSQQQEPLTPEDGQQASPGGQQQQQEPESEHHAGQGSDSAMKQMRVWEERRASHSGGRHRQGPI
jgi:hypothetical protein